MARYAVVLERGDDGGWSGFAPDLPGLLLAGDTREELLASAPGAIVDYLESLREGNHPVPAPAQIELVQIAV